MLVIVRVKVLGLTPNKCPTKLAGVNFLGIGAESVQASLVTWPNKLGKGREIRQEIVH